MSFVLLPYYYYLLVPYFWTIWIQRPFVVFFIYLVFQSIWGVIKEPFPLSEFLGWQSLTVLAGVLNGMVFLWVIKPPFLLRFEDRFVSVWIKALISTTFFIGATIPYAVWLVPTYAWGILLSTGLIIVALGVTWFSLYWVKGLFKGYKEDVTFFFLYWIGTTITMSVSFYLTYVIIERWAAFCSFGITLVITLSALIFCPYHHKSSKRTNHFFMVGDQETGDAKNLVPKGTSISNTLHKHEAKEIAELKKGKNSSK